MRTSGRKTCEKNLFGFGIFQIEIEPPNVQDFVRILNGTKESLKFSIQKKNYPKKKTTNFLEPKIS